MLIAIFIISALIWLLCWRCVFAYNQRKGSRKIVSHFLGIVIGLFPGYFFLYSAIMSFLPSPNGVEPSVGDLITVWAIFALTVLGVLYMTSRPIPVQTGPQTLVERMAMRPDVEGEKESGTTERDTLKRDEGF